MKTDLFVGVVIGILLATLLRKPVDNFIKETVFTPFVEADNEGELCEHLEHHLKTVWSPGGTSYLFVRILVDTCGWYVVMDPKNATIIWTTGHSDMPKAVPPTLKLGDGQIWSQLPDGWVLADKAKLHKLLVSVNHTEYQPETYLLDDPKECVDFFNAAKAEPDTIWVTKEPTSSMGDGIVVNPDINVLKEAWLEDPTSEEFKCKDTRRKDVLIQRYLLNPLLLEGKKMEIRSYWLIASVEPFIVLYRDGTVRLTTRDYHHGDWSDPLIHITNTKQQKKADPNYEQTETQRKWTLQQLSQYLKKENKITEDPEVWLDSLRDMLKERIAVAALGAHPYLVKMKQRPGWDGRFELFGMDVILDDNLYPWLTELQDGPSLSMDPGIKQHVIPTMIKQIINVELEIDRSLRFGKRLSKPLKSLGDWHFIELDKYIHLLPRKKNTEK